jgi:hypothetical protein
MVWMLSGSVMSDITHGTDFENLADDPTGASGKYPV